MSAHPFAFSGSFDVENQLAALLAPGASGAPFAAGDADAFFAACPGSARQQQQPQQHAPRTWTSLSKGVALSGRPRSMSPPPRMQSVPEQHSCCWHPQHKRVDLTTVAVLFCTVTVLVLAVADLLGMAFLFAAVPCAPRL